MANLLKIFFGINESGVAYWRGKLPGLKLMEKGLADVRMFSVYDTRPQDAEQMIRDSDIVFCPSPCGVDAVAEWLKYYQLNKATVADYDDNLFDCHPFNPGYSTLGLNEVKIRVPQPDGSTKEEWIWADHEGARTPGFNLTDNRCRFASHVDVMNVSTLITTTTPYLQEVLAKSANRAKDDFHIVPNSIDFGIYRPFERPKKTSKLRIGWTASDSHTLEAQLSMKVIRELFRRRRDFEFVILGNVEKFRKAAEGLEIEWHSFVDIDIYPLKLASLELDIGICPLDDFSFNYSKSALKWSEYSAMKAATVASDIEPYRIIRSCEDGLLAKTPEEFVDRIELLMDDSGLRKRISEAAWERNFNEYNLDKNVYLWLEVFERAALRADKLTYKGKFIPTIKEPVSK